MSARPVVPASLIIASRDRAAMLRDSVGSVLRGRALPAELIVVDQSEIPDPAMGAMGAVEGCTVRYLWSPTPGLCRANNLGVREAAHDLLVFTHDDVDVDPTWLDALTSVLAAAGRDTVVTGRILAAPDAAGGGYAPTLRTDTEPAVYHGRLGYDVLKPLNMAMYRATLEAVGGFDERLGPGTPFAGAEDADLGHRLLEAGCTIRYVPEAVVHHRAWRSESEYLPLRWAYGVAQGAFYAKHFRSGGAYVPRRILKDVLRRARRFPARLVREPRRALGDPAFVLGNVVGAYRWRRHARTASG